MSLRDGGSTRGRAALDAEAMQRLWQARGAGLLGWSGMQNEEVVGSAGWGGWIGSGRIPM